MGGIQICRWEYGKYQDRIRTPRQAADAFKHHQKRKQLEILYCSVLRESVSYKIAPVQTVSEREGCLRMTPRTVLKNQKHAEYVALYLM